MRGRLVEDKRMDERKGVEQRLVARSCLSEIDRAKETIEMHIPGDVTPHILLPARPVCVQHLSSMQ
jgi:hypothetical protein